MARPELEQGGSIIFAWGPPWNWLPSIKRSRYGNGINLTWLWWGLYFTPRPVAWFLIGATLHWLKKAERDEPPPFLPLPSTLAAALWEDEGYHTTLGPWEQASAEQRDAFMMRASRLVRVLRKLVELTPEAPDGPR